MTHQRWKSFLAPLAITAASVLSFTACSGHDDEEQVAPDSANNEANEEKADAPNEEAAGDTAGEAKAAADSTSESTSAEGSEGGDATASAAASAEAPAGDTGDGAAAAPVSDTVASSEAPAPTAAPAEGGAAALAAAPASASAPASAAAPAPAGGAAPAQAAAAPAPAGPVGRVVRYIQVDQTGLHSQASDASPVTMRLAQGDILMVLEENGWGRVTDELFVKLDAVSNRAVPRSFEKPEWQSPAH